VTNFKLQYPLLLAPIEPTDSEMMADEKMRIVATFVDIYIARRAIAGKSLTSGTLLGSMFGLMRDLRVNSEISALSDFLRSRLADQPEQLDEATFDGFRRHQLNQKFVFIFLARLSWRVERESATPTTLSRYLARKKGNRYDIEHVWPETLDAYVERYPNRFRTREDAEQFRERVGGLVLLPEKVNRSLQAKPFSEKRDQYLADNLLAGSLHQAAYVNNPGFTRWIAEADLPFESYDDFTAEAIDERQRLYLRLAQLVWSPDQLTPSPEALAS
jgi:Protein of unknown function (DUF1524)